MSTDRKTFTTDYLNNLPVTPGKAREFREKGGTGMVCRVEPTGRKTLYVTYRIKDSDEKPRRTRLATWDGEYATLEAARARAAELVGQAREGIDPEPDRSKPKEPEPVQTVRVLVDEFLRKGTNNAANFGPRLRDVVVENWGDLHPAELPEDAFDDVLWALIDDGEYPAARTLRDATRAFYNWLDERHRIRVRNPAGTRNKKQLAKMLRKQKRHRTPYTPEELRKAYAATLGWEYPLGPVTRLSLLTGTRSDFLAQLRWDWVHDDTFDLLPNIDLPQEQRKRVPPTLPITPAIREVFDEARAHRSNGHVFANGAGGPCKPKATLLRDRAGIEQKDIKELQHTMSTNMARLGVPQEVINYIKGHGPGGSASTYNTHRYVEEARDALAKYEAYILELVKQ